jgi:hypothetical protein
MTFYGTKLDSIARLFFHVPFRRLSKSKKAEVKAEASKYGGNNVKRKKRAWNSSNPLYRYLHGGKSRTKSKGGNSMARRHKRRGSRGGFGGGRKIFGLGTKGLLPSLGIAGVIGAALFADEIAAMIPVNVPAKDYLISYAIAGPAGVAARFAAKSIMPSMTGGSSAVYL